MNDADLLRAIDAMKVRAFDLFVMAANGLPSVTGFKTVNDYRELIHAERDKIKQFINNNLEDK
jgi:hypothetical protein